MDGAGMAILWRKEKGKNSEVFGTPPRANSTPLFRSVYIYQAEELCPVHGR